ncbi:hypothetical protein BDW02DRAFT_642353 [Decorospora gaudefroyi]|uniref:Spindle pole body component n=1 Tax=Decorospora gaudefroyi TaxID=184978 RepID=A0A6A5JYN8_9PLEO|nr:hypothetical protein BDW02DRAFT_642353 [Decorospora gaudefroyi]
MAQNTRISGLTDELIQSILKFDPATNKHAYKHAKDIASRNLRGHQYARTNQFEVTASLAGLDEKFRIKSRDDLADALQVRLQKLDGYTNKYKPDLLSLLLQLADRPLENTQVEALELLRPPSPPPPLTWSEILHDDPYSDEEIWKDVDYGGDSSGDDRTPKKRAKLQASPPTSVDGDESYDPESCVTSADKELVAKLEAAQFWSSVASERDSEFEITELQAVRETLFMLAGLQTNLYQIDKKQHNIRLNSKYVLNHARPATMGHLLSQFAHTGNCVGQLRQWTGKVSTSPLIQTFEAAVRKRLLLFDRSLSTLQHEHLIPQAPIPVSLLQLYSDVQTLSMPILRLSRIVSDIEPQLLKNPFSHLEALFEHTTLSQMTLEVEVFSYMSGVFFECLQTYLKPIRRWMEAGELGSDEDTFFVFANDSSSDTNSLWHDRYVLRRDGQNKLRSPSFLQPAAKKIFNTGKSVVFLKELGIYDTDSHALAPEPHVDHATVCGASNEMPLSPFPELFQTAFDGWIRSKYSVASTVLRNYIFKTDGLMHVLNVFEILYLGRNGAVFEDFASAVFERIDARRRGWSDRYILTELARGVFGTVLATSNADKIVVRSMKAKAQGKSVKGLAAVSIRYALPWSLQNIIQRSSIFVYQEVFTFLVQVYRVKYLVQRLRTRRPAKPRSNLYYKLQHRLTWFIDMVRSYLTETVIFFTTLDMNTSMEKAEDIDEMAHIHTKYTMKLHERALLSTDVKPIHKAIIEVLDLGVLFAQAKSTDHKHDAAPKTKKTQLSGRKSTAPVLVEDVSDDDEDAKSGSDDGVKNRTDQSPREILKMVDREFERLLPFITAGLRSVGRVGAEPMWEQLADRLEWAGKKDRVY